MIIVALVLLGFGAVFTYTAASIGVSWAYVAIAVAGGVLSWWFDKLDRSQAARHDPGLVPRWTVPGMLSAVAIIGLPTFGPFLVGLEATPSRLWQGVTAGLFAKGVAVYTEVALSRGSRPIPPA